MSHPWIIDDKIASAIREKADKHEIRATNSNVDRLEHSLRQACTEIAGLCSKVEMLEGQIADLSHDLVDHLNP